MSYPVTKLISEAYYASGIVSRQFQQVTGDQVALGLELLNETLTDTAIETDMIPYFNSSYSFHAVAGQEEYYIPNLDQPETLTFYISSIRYQMRNNSRDQYFGQGRADNVLSLPFNWHTERCFGGSNLFMYFFPDTNYPMTLTGLFRLSSVTLSQNLNSSYATANLGYPIASGAGVLAEGELVVDGFDLEGTYASPFALVTYINTGIIPYISARITDGQFILTDISGTSITVETNGSGDETNGVTFSNFSTVSEPKDQTFLAMVLDEFYISYLKYRVADKLCSNSNFTLPPGSAKELLKYQQMISKRSSPMDLTIGKISTLTGQSSINYGQVNLGKGWSP